MLSLLQRAWHWFDDRTGTSKLLGPVLAHPVPRGAKWSYVFGSATLFAFMVQVVTGIALATAYVTSTGDAYASLQFITHDPFGHLLRGMHFYGASAMILMHLPAVLRSLHEATGVGIWLSCFSLAYLARRTSTTAR